MSAICALWLSVWPAHAAGGEGLSRAAELSASAMGISLPQAPAAVPEVPVGVVVQSSEPVVGDERSDESYEYPDVSKALERYDSFKRVSVGKGKHKVVPHRRTGVQRSERLDAGSITHVVLHSSLGQAATPQDLAQRDEDTAAGRRKYDSCQSSVNWLHTRATAAHYIVCRDGRVKQMAEIKDIANHVKDPESDQHSVGIETDTGFAGKTPFFPGGGGYAGDWDPDTRWRQSRSLAMLIRMLSKLTEGRIALDANGVRTHDEVDGAYCRGSGCRSHTDPGPYFKGESVKSFGDPAAMTTPWGNLLRLVGDSKAPQTMFQLAPGAGDRIRAVDDTGLHQLIVWQLTVPRAALAEAKAAQPDKPVVRKVSGWTAEPAVMPPAARELELPIEPGEYQLEARDIVGNRTYRDFDILADAAPVLAGAAASTGLRTRLSDLGERSVGSLDDEP